MHVVEAFGGGVFTFLSDLTSYQTDFADVIIVYTKRPETPKNFKTFFPKNIKFIESKYLSRSINPARELKAVKELKKIIEKERPDIVHLHSSKAGAIGRLACRHQEGTKLFYNPHGFSFLMEDSSPIKRKLFFQIEKFLAKTPCTIIACSKGEYIEAKKLTKNCIEIDNGLNLEKISQELKNLPTHKNNYTTPTVCTVGRIDYQKNPATFNEIAKQNPNLKFVWIGDGDLRPELTAPNITVTGWLSRQQVLEKLNGSDVFLLTSLWEGLPISLLEAMYLKKLCIVSDVIGNHDVIKNRQNGFVVKTPSNFTKIISSLNKLEAPQLINSAHQDILQKYNLSTIAQKYQEAYL